MFRKRYNDTGAKTRVFLYVDRRMFRSINGCKRYSSERCQDLFRTSTFPMSSRPEAPFDSIENAQDYLRLLLETIVEARKDIAADLTAAEEAKLERRREALRLVQYKLESLEQHLRSSSRTLNDLRTLRRLLLDERA